MNNYESFTAEPTAVYTKDTVSIHEAKTNFSKLVKRAQAGETIFIGAYGKPSVALISSDALSRKKPVIEAFGCMKGKIKYSEGWENWTEEELYEMFYSSFMTLEEYKKP